ncbi:tRNA-dihydrouridine synthase 3 [Rhizina undulata]
MTDVDPATLKRESTLDQPSEPTPKKPKLSDDASDATLANTDLPTPAERRPGVAAIKPEFLLHRRPSAVPARVPDDDAAEAGDAEGKDAGESKGKRKRGQNKGRKFQFDNDELRLCHSLVTVVRESDFENTVCEYAANAPEGGPRTKNPRGRGNKNRRGRDEEEEEKAEEAGKAEGEPESEGKKKCAFSHDLREYLAAKRGDLEGPCPVYAVRGTCGAGWRCRWVSSHSIDENGELRLLTDPERQEAYRAKVALENARKREKVRFEYPENGSQEWEKEVAEGGFDDPYGEVVNNIPVRMKIMVRKNEFGFEKSKAFMDWVDKTKGDPEVPDHENRAMFVETPLRPEEKRRLYIGADTPLLAPLTTTGNLPFRRLCTSLGAALTYSEMAMSVPLLQGHKPEWALLRAHTSELPTFGAQICGTKIAQVVRATEVLTSFLPTASSGRHGLNVVDLNCGCPIDLVYKNGGGSALLDQQSKLSKMLKGMNYVSGSTPITVKIRMGTKDAAPSAKKLVQRLLKEGDVQAITLHGRSRQQRYTRRADWGYIAETAALIKSLKKQHEELQDSADAKEKPEAYQTFFIGNGDCYSHIDYNNAIQTSGVDSVMLARGALIKPWVFEEISAQQYLDKSSSQRLDYIKDYVRYGLECWGSDELGVATTRRFLLEWMSFTCRYVPTGLLEYLPPNIQDRPPAWKGRDELETLLGSQDSRDWEKVAEMFLGKDKAGGRFVPKHKSNAYDDEAEG